mgnify:CR=1 FL=1
MRRNESVEQVQKLVGHSSALMTEYYTKAEIPEVPATITLEMLKGDEACALALEEAGAYEDFEYITAVNGG